MAYSVPAMPAKAAEITKAISLKRVVEMPTESAAMRLSRTAMTARPWRLLIKFSTMNSVMRIRMKPAVKFEILSMPETPMGPLMIMSPPSFRVKVCLIMLKCSPRSSMPT